jgi:hypothetical protein
MVNSAIYYTAAAQHPPKVVKFDFYFMHCVNSSIFWSTFNQLPWLSIQNKIRLLEWKGRIDLIMYASRRSPPLLLEEISGYVPKDLERGEAEWKGIVRRVSEFEGTVDPNESAESAAYSDKIEDGHAIKLVRAVKHGEEVSKKYEDEEWCKIKDFMWLKIGNMVVDSVEEEGATWARSVGFEQAWEEYKDRPKEGVFLKGEL